MRHGYRLLVASLVISGACKKADNTPAAGSGSAAGSAAVASGSAAPTPEAGGSGKATDDKTGSAAPVATGNGNCTPAVGPTDDLALIPIDSEVVVGLNFQALVGSPMYKLALEKQMSGQLDDYEKFKDKCGIDPLKEMKSISIGMSNVAGKDGQDAKPTGVMVVHGLDKAKTLACIDKVKDDAAKEGTVITKSGDVIILDNTKDNTKSNAMFLNDSTLLIAVGGDSCKLAEVAKGTNALKGSKAFSDMFAKIDQTHTAWGVVNGSSPVFAGAAPFLNGAKFKAVYGSLNVTDGVAVEVRARMDSADQASAFAAQLNQKIGGFKGMVDKLDLTNDGAEVKGSLAISAEKLKQLQAMGGGGGGMGAP